MIIMFLIYVIIKVIVELNKLVVLALFKRLFSKFKYIVPFLLLSNTSIHDRDVKVETIMFNIMKKETNIGTITINKSISELITTYHVNSNILAKLILTFKINCEERSVFKNDTLVFSSVYRTLNNKEKVNQSLEFINGNYYLQEEGKKVLLNIETIRQNLVTLYFVEPIGINKVFCDKQNLMVNLIYLKKGKYKVVFPNGDYNIFYYINGKCSMIEAVNSWCEVKLIPTY